jgi:small-conductance mechanosensitive channel
MGFMGLSKVLACAAVVEFGTGVVLLLDPAIVVAFLFGGELSGVGTLVGRCLGIALIALGVACWPGRERREADVAPCRAMLGYNALIALYLAYQGVAGQAAGLLLWPAVVLHAGTASLLVWRRHREQAVTTSILWWLIAGVLAAAAPAMAQSVPAEPTAEQVKAFLEHHSDPVVGAWVAQQLQGNGPTPLAAPAPQAATAGLVEEEEASVAGFLAGRLHLVEQHFAGLAAAVPALPAEFAMVSARLTDEISDRGLAEVVPLLLAFAGLGLGAELLLTRTTARLAERIRSAAVVSVRQRMRLVRTKLQLGLARALCFAVGSMGGFLLFSWPPHLKHLVLGYLGAFLALRFAFVLGDLLFAPDQEQLRVVPMRSLSAAFWRRWIAVFVGWLAFGIVSIQLLRRLGMTEPTLQLLAYFLGIGLLGLALWAIWRPRRAPRRGRQVARTLLATAMWAAWVAGAKPLLWAMVVVTALAVAVRATHRAVKHLYRPPDHVEGSPEPEPLSTWAVVVDRGVRFLLIVAAVWTLLTWGWGIDVIELTGRDTPATRLVIGAVHAVVILLVADLLWQLARTTIDRRLHDAEASAGLHGNGHGPELSADEMRRRGRIRTLLPILRLMLLVVLSVMAVLMALSALGVQIGPLVAGAGVVGVAIGFGSQTLVRDIISGMFYLLDDAFRVGEYIVSGNYRGTVEGFSLRSIRLRHHRGPIFTVPFGMLGAVQNLSRDWVIDKITLSVRYDTDLDLVKRVIKQVSREIMADPALAKAIIEPPKSQGVAAMGDTGIQVQLKFMAKPGQQFTIRRAIYDRVKKAFAANGISFAAAAGAAAPAGGAPTPGAGKPGIELAKAGAA